MFVTKLQKTNSEKKVRSMEMQFSENIEPKSMQQGQQIKYKNNNDQ